jgi:hypothetical protein
MKSGKYRLEVEIMFNDSLDNDSHKLWSRHNAGGDASNRYGGMGLAYSHTDVDCKEETYHNVHIQVGNKKLAKPIPNGKWVALRSEIELQMPAKKFICEAFIDYDLTGNFEKVASFTYTSKASGVNDELPELYCWNRTNGAAFEVPMRNEKYVKLA